MRDKQSYKKEIYNGYIKDKIIINKFLQKERKINELRKYSILIKIYTHVFDFYVLMFLIIIHYFDCSFRYHQHQ